MDLKSKILNQVQDDKLRHVQDDKLRHVQDDRLRHVQDDKLGKHCHSGLDPESQAGTSSKSKILNQVQDDKLRHVQDDRLRRVQDDKLKAFILFILFILTLSCQREQLPIAAVDPIPEIMIVEDHSEVLVEWMQRGYRSMVLVNVDQHDDLRLISESRISTLKRLYESKEWDKVFFERDKGVASLYTLSDFIYAAYRLGIIKKLYWIATSSLLESDEPEKGIRAFLGAFGYPEEIISTFRKSGNAIRGNIYGLEVTISTIQTFPAISEPVLLTIDTDYFSNVLRKTGASELAVITDFFNTMKAKRLQVRDVSVSYSVHGDYTFMTDRHIGDEVAELFKQPAILDKNQFPPLWFIRDRGFGLLRAGQNDDALNMFEESLRVFPDEPTLVAGKAFALSAKGMEHELLNAIEKIVQKNPGYDYLYITAAKEAASQGNTDRAKRLLDAYLGRNPDSFYGLIAYGDILYEKGDDEGALRMYQKILEKGEHASAVMYTGDALVHLGRYREAMTYYERGLRLINEVGYHSLRDFPESVRNMEIIRAKGLLQ